MAYKLSEQLEQKKHIVTSKLPVNLKKIANVFFCFGIISLFTAWIFDTETKQIFMGKVGIFYSTLTAQQADEQGESNSLATIGPINVQKYKEVYEIDVASTLPKNTWVFVKGEVLDSKKNYLFSFGKKLWRETVYYDNNERDKSDTEYSMKITFPEPGQYDNNERDERYESDESDTEYSMKITFPEPGQYYLNLKTKGSYSPDALQVNITKKLGSSIPHKVFAIITILIGIILNEIINRTLTKFFTVVLKFLRFIRPLIRTY